MVGRLADSADTLYLQRTSRRDAHRVLHTMAERLQQGDVLAFFPEGTTSEGVDLIDPATKALTGRFRVAHATTPVDAGHMLYFWAAGRDFGTAPDQMAALDAITQIGFAEDEAMIEAIQTLQDRDPRGAQAPEFSVKMDTAGIAARRIVQRWMERERHADA